MAIIQFSDKDLLRSRIVEPAWYRVKIDSVGEAPANSEKGPSTNFPVEATIVCKAENGDDKDAGVPLSWMFNSKALGFAVPFLQAFGVDVKAGQRFDLNNASGQEIEIFVDNDTYNNRLQNKVNHKYRALTAVTAK